MAIAECPCLRYHWNVRSWVTSQRVIDNAELTLCLYFLQGRHGNIRNGWCAPFLVPVISQPALYPRLYPYVYATLIPRSRHSFLSALPRNQTSPPNAHLKFQNTHLPRAPPFYGCAFREQKGMLVSPQGRQWEQHLYRGRGRGREFECAPWDGRFDAVEEVSGSERGGGDTLR